MSATGLRTIVASEHAMSCDLDNLTALLDIVSNKYYTLNNVGAFVWSLLRSPRSLDDVCASVTQTYAVSAEQCRIDVTALISNLEAAGLVRVEDAVSSVVDLENRLPAAMPARGGSDAGGSQHSQIR